MIGKPSCTVLRGLDGSNLTLATRRKLTIDVCPKNTSQLCSNCKKKVPKGLSTRWHKCIYCGSILHRDHNAAKNILARGIEVLLADGLAVIAPGGLALAGSVKGEPENPLSKESRSLTP